MTIALAGANVGSFNSGTGAMTCASSSLLTPGGSAWGGLQLGDIIFRLLFLPDGTANNTYTNVESGWTDLATLATGGTASQTVVLSMRVAAETSITFETDLAFLTHLPSAYYGVWRAVGSLSVLAASGLATVAAAQNFPAPAKSTAVGATTSLVLAAFFSAGEVPNWTPPSGMSSAPTNNWQTANTESQVAWVELDGSSVSTGTLTAVATASSFDGFAATFVVTVNPNPTYVGRPPTAMHRMRGPWQKPGMFVRPRPGVTKLDTNPQPLPPSAPRRTPQTQGRAPWIKPGMFARPRPGIVVPTDNAVVAKTLDSVTAIASTHVSSQKTLRSIEGGSTRYVYVVAIEGYKYLLTDGDPAAAVTAWAGSDWSLALPGLFVELDNQQTFDPWQPFLGGGTCGLMVQPDPTDRFGIDLARTLTVPETEITNSLDRAATGINVKSTSGFDVAPGEAFCGNECFSYASVTSTKFGTCVRGRYSPFSAGAGGTGAPRWGEMHRFGNVDYSVHAQALVTKTRRTWIGAWVGVWMHRVVGGVLDPKTEATLVYAGQIADTGDDPATGYATVNLKHVLDVVRDTTLLRDQFSAEIADGIFLTNGMQFGIGDGNITAQPLNIGDPASPYPWTPGFYTVDDIITHLNGWIAGEQIAGRLAGQYRFGKTFAAGASTTAFQVAIVVDQSSSSSLEITLPYLVAALLGAVDGNLYQHGGFLTIVVSLAQAAAITVITGVAGIDGWTMTADSRSFTFGNVPYRTLFGGAGTYDPFFPVQLAATSGTLFDQYSLLPAAYKPAQQIGLGWGAFMINGQNLLIAAISNNVVVRSWLYFSDGTDLSLKYDGTNTQNELKQIAILEGSWATLLQLLFRGSGTVNYNDGTNDTIGYGLGANLPGELLGTVFDASVNGMVGGDLVETLWITKAQQLAEYLNVDCILRGIHLIFKLGFLSLAQWSTPQFGATSITLTEHNKSEPAGNQSNQRSASVLTSQWAHPTVKISFDWDPLADTFGDTLTLEDEIAVDDSGGVPNPISLEARNLTAIQIDLLVPQFFARWVPNLSRPVHMLTRSISPAFYEGVSVGDTALVADSFARDPSTGVRGITARTGLIVRHEYNPGGATAGTGGQPRQMQGEVDVIFLPTDRTSAYSPAAEVDQTLSTGSFSAGYSSSTNTLSFHPSEHTLNNDANNDLSYFAVDDVVEIVETDPADPAAPLRWAPVTILSRAANAAVIDTVLVGWDATKRYRMRSVSYLSAQPTQQANAYEADATVGEISGTAPPFQYSLPTIAPLVLENLQPAELTSNLADADGAPRDTGYDRALARTINNLIDAKTAHQSPALDATERLNSYGSGFLLTHLSRVFLGTQSLFQSQRLVAVALRLRSTTGAYVRAQVTLTPNRPIDASLQNVTFVAPYTRATFLTNSTTYGVTDERTIDLFAAGLAGVGWAWLCVEVEAGGATTGVAEFIERARS